MKHRRTAAFVLLALALLLLVGCAGQKGANLKTGSQIPSGAPESGEDDGIGEAQEDADDETEKQKLYAILQIDFEGQELRLQNVENGKVSEYGISDATAFRDKYGGFAGNSAMQQGKIVTIGAESASGNLSYVQLSDKAWEQENVKKFSIDQGKKIITIGKTKYYYDDTLLVFLDNEQMSLDPITEKDSLRVSGVDRKIASVVVTSGHGFLTVTHTDLFEGGWLSVGNVAVQKIEKGMKVELPEGTYEVSVANDGYGDTKEVTIARNETTTINLEDYKGEGPKMGKVHFKLTPEDAKLTIDGETVDPSAPLELRYGTYRLTVSDDTYGEFKRVLVVSSPEVDVELDLRKLSGKDVEEDEEENQDGDMNGQDDFDNSGSQNDEPDKDGAGNATESTPGMPGDASGAGSGTTGSASAGQSSAGSGTSGSGSAGQSSTGSGTTGSGSAGQSSAGSSTTGSASGDHSATGSGGTTTTPSGSSATEDEKSQIKKFFDFISSWLD